MKLSQCLLPLLLVAAAGVNAVIIGCGRTGSGVASPYYGPGTGPVGSFTFNGTGVSGIGSLSPGVSMNIGRYFHTATAIPAGIGAYVNGGVLVCGGETASGPFLVVIENEIYDTKKNTWSLVSSITPGDSGYMTNLHPNLGAPVHTARTRHMAVKLTSTAGKILVGGGLGVQDNAPLPSNPLLTTCFVFDPSANTFTQVDDMPHARMDISSVALSTGLVLVCGGLKPPPPPPPPSFKWGIIDKTAWLFDYSKPPGAEWVPIGGPPPGGFAADSTDVHWGATLLAQAAGKAVIAGGANVFLTDPAPPFPYAPYTYYLDFPTFPTAKSQLFDSSTMTFSAGPTLTVDRFLAAGTAMANGDALIGGGLVSSIPSAVLKTIDYFDHTVTPAAFSAVPNSFIFCDPDSDPSATPPLVPTIDTKAPHEERYWATCGEVDGGRSGDVLFSGGYDSGGAIYPDACLWQLKIKGMNDTPDSPAPGAWPAFIPPCVMPMLEPRVNHANASLFDGRLQLSGGFNGLGPTASTETYGH